MSKELGDVSLERLDGELARLLESRARRFLPGEVREGHQEVPTWLLRDEADVGGHGSPAGASQQVPPGSWRVRNVGSALSSLRAALLGQGPPGTSTL